MHRNVATDLARASTFVLVLAVGAYPLASCVRAGFGESERPAGDGATNAGSAGTRDGGDGQATGLDQGTPRLQCATPTAVTAIPTWRSVSPALSADGLALTSLGLGRSTIPAIVATRSGLGGAFERWETLPWEPTYQDPSYINIAGTDRVFVAAWDASGAPPRQLLYCSTVLALANNCTALTLWLSDTERLAGDFDGPSVIDDQGELLLAFNRNASDLTGSELYLGRPRDRTNLVWDVRELTELGSTNIRRGDPTLSADGNLIVYERLAVEGEDNWDLWVAYRLAGAESYGSPEALTNLNSADSEIEPAIHVISAGHYELYFVRRQETLRQVFRATCTGT
jgi:hypothetical protein